MANFLKTCKKNTIMTKKKHEEHKTEEETKVTDQSSEATNEQELKAAKTDTVSKEDVLLGQLAELQDKNLRLMAEFDNFRKRTLKEKMELIKTGGESVIVNVLPVVDDMERALKALETAQDFAAMKEGLTLIFGKFNQFLSQNNVKEIETIGQPLDTDKHEAIANIPAPTEALKGKIVDVIQKGYYLQDKVIRYAKVIVGE